MTKIENIEYTGMFNNMLSCYWEIFCLKKCYHINDRIRDIIQKDITS